MRTIYHNDFTRECDKYRVDSYMADAFRTYIYHDKNIKEPELFKTGEYGYIFRTPGATRGAIVVDKDTMIIKKIVFYDDECFKGPFRCYTKDVINGTKKLIGTKFEF